MLRHFLALWSLAMLSVAGFSAERPNVLYIAVDDLNHWVGHLHRNDQTQTPNIDALAKRGVSFSHAYCAAPACNPSRAALMSGLLPSTTGVYLNSDDWRPHIAPELTMNQYFRDNGYSVKGAGKIYHGSMERDADWDEYVHPKPIEKASAKGGVGGIKFDVLPGGDKAIDDYAITNYCIEQLGQKHDKPFFLACGLHKPHMPWNVPKKYFDMFPLESIELPPHIEGDLADIPSAGRKMAKPEGDHARMLESGRWKEAVQAYLATIAYTDMNIGRLMAAFDKSEYKENTIIVLWGDHGWHLGEKEHWRKFSLWEEATRAPLIWVAPNVTAKNVVCDEVVSFMSIYPTLCDLCNLPIPKHIQGKSIKPLLANPKQDWDGLALTTHGYKNHTVRVKDWRYIRYADGSEELYNEMDDPYERTNLADVPKYDAVKKRLAQFMPKAEKKPTPKKPRNKRNSK